jgi:hypothetical protein
MVVWPFIKAVIFKDRSVMEVLNDNRQFTRLFAVLVVVALMFYVTLNELSETKVALKTSEQEVTQLRNECSSTPIPDDDVPTSDKPPRTLYDKRQLLEMLDID